MDYIKEAFSKVKSDISFLQSELNNLKTELKENKQLMIKICENIQEIFDKVEQTDLQREQKEFFKNPNFFQEEQVNNERINPAHPQINPTHYEKIPTDKFLFKPLNPQNWQFSTGNKGVPTDRQTNQQTDQQHKNSIENAAEMLESLNSLKKEISKKFKNLTEQEWMVFAAIYQLDEERGHSDYSILAEKLKLSESSIRDYVARLIKKGISLDKTKINNKNVKLNIPKSLKQIASLSVILALRDV